MTLILIASFVIMLASLIGVFSVWKRAGHFVEKNLAFLVSFSAGVFLVVSYNLSFEVIEHANAVSSGLFWIAVGAVGILVLFRMLPHFHHHHDESEEESSHSRIDIRRILIGDSLHNVGDCILLTSAFVISPVIGLIAMVSIFVHELVQEVSEFFVLRQAGFSARKALALNFLVSATILIGSLGGYILLEAF